MYHSVLKIKTNCGRLEFFKIQSSNCLYASSKHLFTKSKQKHLGYKKVQGQSEATSQTGMCDQKL